jgi:hypothetical protein
MQKIRFLPILALFTLFQISTTQLAMANGAAIGIDLNIIDNVITNESNIIEDHIFIAGEGFFNYYNDDTVNYNYGVKGNLGYKILGIEAYGVLGVQNVNFSSDKLSYFKTTRSPLYGFGIGYDLPIGPKIRLETNYFTLDHRGTGNSKRFTKTGVSVVFGF